MKSNYIYNKDKIEAKVYLIFVKLLEIVFKLYKNKKNKFPDRIEKILLIKPDHMGDTIISTICFQPLKENYPNAKIDILCGSWGEKTYEYQNKVNKIFILDHVFLNRNNMSMYKKIYIFIQEYLKVIKELKKENYDLCIMLRAPLKGNLMTLIPFIKPKYTLGYIGMSCEELLDIKIDYSLYIPERENFLNLLKSIPDFKLRKEKYQYELLLPESKLIQEKIKELNIDEKKINILFNTDGNEKNRKLSVEKILEILKELEKKENFQVYIVYIPNEEKKMKLLEDEIEKNKLKNTKILFKTNSLFELGEIIKKMDMVITVDTAVTHLASLYVEKMVVIYEKNPIKFPRFSSNCEKECSIICDDNNVNNFSNKSIIEYLEKKK